MEGRPMPASVSCASASTPPRRVRHRSPSSTVTPSRVDVIFGRHPRGFGAANTTAPSDGEESEMDMTSAAASPSRGWEAAPEEVGVSAYQCRSCHDTRRLRASLKRVEAAYVAEIESLRAQLHEAVAQRAAAVQERNELLSCADTAVADRVHLEQEAQALRLEVMELAQEMERLRRRSHNVEKQRAVADERQRAAALAAVAGTETVQRANLVSAEQDEMALLSKLQSAEVAAVAAVAEAGLAVARAAAERTMAASTKAACGAAAAVAVGAVGAGLHTSGCGGFSPTTSSPGPSEEEVEDSRERRTCSPRPSQRRSLSGPPDTPRTMRTSPSPRSHSGHGCAGKGAAELCRTGTGGGGGGRVAPVSEADAAGEAVRRLEWSIEQQRSAYEMQLAEERALTGEMQAEVDDLIENELVLLEGNSRVALERDASDAYGDLLGGLLEQLGAAWRAASLAGNGAVEACRESEPPACRVAAEAATATCGSDDAQARVEAAVQRVLAEVVEQRRRSEETYAVLRRFSRVSTHNDDAIFRAVQRVETSVTTHATSTAATSVNIPRPPALLQTEPLSSTSAADVTLSSSTAATPTSAAGTPSVVSHAGHGPTATASPPAVAAAAPAPFHPHRVHLDTSAAARDMAAIFCSDSSDEDVGQTPYDDEDGG